MERATLKKTKHKLTIIFTVLVFSLAVLLESVFFSAKYYNYISTEKQQFHNLTNSVEKKFITLNEYITQYDLWRRIFKLKQDAHIDIAQEAREEFVNIIIIDRKKIEVVFSNVVDEISISFVERVLNKESYGTIEQDLGYFVKKIYIKESDRWYDVLFIKDLKYNFWDYLTDLLSFIFITFLFSTLFYYSWLKFVWKNLEPVEENLQDMQDFIHNAGHELKTPIAVIDSNLQLMKQTKTFEKELITEWLDEVSRLNHLIESLVELSNINQTEQKEHLDVVLEIKTIIKDFSYEAKKKNISVVFDKKYGKILQANKQYFYILFSNLLGNAIKYSNEWWKVKIMLSKDSISIKDNGIGIKEKYIDRIWDRFFMWSKCRNNPWHGIWLSLVKKIADMYKWKIIVKSEEGKWSEFIVKIK